MATEPVYSLVLRAGAMTARELREFLHTQADRLIQPMAAGGIDESSAEGGPVDFHLVLSCNPEANEEAYIGELNAWMDEVVKGRRGG